MSPSDKKIRIHGLDLDDNGRCRHYHKNCDVVALKCSACGRYYACYECHDALEDHTFAATDLTEEYPVLCGNCHTTLTREEYLTGSCVHCGFSFNPNCKLHYGIYFRQ